MGVLSKWLGFDKAVQKAFNTGLQQNLFNSVLSLGWNVAAYPPVDTATAFKRAFEQNAVFFSIVDRIAEKFGHIPRYVYKPEKNKALDENIADGELMQLLLRPNEYQGQDQFFYLAGLSYKVCGEAFIWKNRGGIIGGKPVELYVIPAWCMQVISDGTLFGVKNYKIEAAGQWVDIPKEDILHWKKPALALDPAGGTHLRGFNPMLPQRKVLTQMDTLTDASVSMYQSGGAKGILYNKDFADISEDQQDRIKGVIDKKVNSSDVKGSVATIQGEWGYLNVGLSAVDMSMVEAEASVIKKICFTLGYPYEMYSGDATHANREESMAHLLTQTIAPLVASFDAELNRSLVPDFKEKGFVASDMSELPEMQAMRLKTALSIQTMDYISPNEKRVMGGWQPRVEPEMDEIWMNTGKMPIGEAIVGKVAGDESDYED